MVSPRSASGHTNYKIYQLTTHAALGTLQGTYVLRLVMPTGGPGLADRSHRPSSSPQQVVSYDRGRGGRDASGASAGEMVGEFINRAPKPRT